MDTGYSMVCPFLTDDPVFAHGVEFGMLYARVRDGGEERIEGYFCRANQDQILLLASRLKWSVEKMEPWGDDWLWIELSQKE